jgi:cephalosporin hydroxylase
MARFKKVAVRFARWALGRSQTGLPPWCVDSIQHGSFQYSYKGISMLKDPFDLALYSLLIGRERPRTIIEIGTYKGGATMWLADQQMTHGIDGMVHSLDIHPVELPATPRIVLHTGNARDIEAIFPPDWIAAQPRPLLVIDDGDHTPASVLCVLEYFADHMRSGEYLVVEDGSVGDLGVARIFKGGPVVAVHEFIARGGPFEIDRSYCDFYGHNMTWNVDGYLRRI